MRKPNFEATHAGNKKSFLSREALQQRARGTYLCNHQNLNNKKYLNKLYKQVFNLYLCVNFLTTNESAHCCRPARNKHCVLNFTDDTQWNILSTLFVYLELMTDPPLQYYINPKKFNFIQRLFFQIVLKFLTHNT